VNRSIILMVMIVSASTPRAAHADDILMPSITHEACTQYAKAHAFDIVAQFQDDSQLFDPKVMYKTRSNSNWRSVAFKKEAGRANFVAHIPAKNLQGPLEYFIEVFDEYGNGPARMGSPDNPIRVTPSRSPAACTQVPQMNEPLVMVTGSQPGGNSTNATTASPIGAPTPVGGTTPAAPQSTCERRDRPLYCEGWLWGTLGVVVLGGAGVAGYLVFGGSNNKTPVTRDSINLTVTAPDPTGIAQP